MDAQPVYAERQAEDYFANDLAMLNAFALQNEYVVAVKSFETENARVFGVLTMPIYLKSERDELVKTLSISLSQGKRAYVSLDNDVFRKIKDDMTEEQKEELLSLVQKRAKR